MALGPKDLNELTKEDEKQVTEIESIIDSYLRAKYDNQTVFNVPLDNVKDMRNKVIKEISTRYTKAGWGDVQIKTSQSKFEVVLKMYQSSAQFER